MKVANLCIGLVLISLSTNAQELVINSNEITYSSDFERKAFESFGNNRQDFFALLLAPDETVTEDDYQKWKSSFEKKLEALRPEFSEKKKE